MGPGEIKSYIGGIYFRDDQIVIPSTGRISYFTRDGKFLKENKMLSTLRWDEVASIAPIGDGFVGCNRTFVPVPPCFLFSYFEKENGKSNYDSNSLRGNPDCRIMDCIVPMRISSWFGTGTVIVL
jgi:hypothetical protein